ncbi:hypothetical protein [Burkholderia gladioli]|uniref:hypothetical protein n=1 Tax=Burkholderia gladioli TaxID=28095 RepID=UPI0030D0AB73
MNISRLTLATLGFLSLSQAQAIVISDDVVTANGGNLKDIPGTIATALEPQRVQSYAPQFLSAGHLDTPGGACTATWLGDSADGKSVFLLTAAHCTEGTQQTGKGNFKFTDWKERTIASGQGSYTTGPYRFSNTPGFGGASTDIALIQLPKIADILDQNGNKVARPVLYDLSDNEGELNKEVWFAGYGSWGTGTGGSNGGYFPKSGPRRAAGAATISSIFENDHGIGAAFKTSVGRDPSKGIDAWTRTASGDSGSAWWQLHSGIWTIIADTNGGSDSLSTGARTSQYVDFIKSVYPQALFLSQVLSERRSTAASSLVSPFSRPSAAGR